MELSGQDIDEIHPELKNLVAEKSEQKFMEILLMLKDLLGKKSMGDQRDLEKCKQDLYYHGVLSYCSAALRFSPAKVEGTYASIAQMADVISTCCVGIGPLRDRDEFQHRFLPSVMENLLFLAHRLMNRAAGGKEQTEMIRLFRKVFDCLGWILKAYGHLIPCVLQSKQFERVQMCEDDEISVVTLMMWHNLFRANSAAIAEIGNKALNSVTDDVVYKMSSSSNPVIGNTAVRILLLITEHHSPSLKLLHTQYKGTVSLEQHVVNGLAHGASGRLDDLVKKDWHGKGFDAALEQLIDRLQSEVPADSKTKHTSEERTRAACVIQAAWRAHQTRCRVKKLPRAVSALQRSFRQRRQRQQEDADRRRAEDELRLQVCLRRQRAVRQFRQRQLHLMEILPADQLARYLGELENRAALLIQRVWRGHTERKHFQQSIYALKQHRAALILQRAILRFLKQRRCQRSLLSPWKGPKGLTDSRRAELKRQIEEHLSLYPSSVKSVEGTQELQKKAQSLLQQHLMTRAADRAREKHRQALLAQINTDLELLLNAPSLKAVGEEDPGVFLSRSAPVATRARQSHNAALQSMRLPWWKMLGDEFSKTESDLQKDYDMEFESLYLGGS